MKNRKLLLVVTSAMATLLQQASATLLVHEPFNYTAGALAGKTANATGLSGNWAASGGTFTVQTTPLSFSGHFAAAGGSLYLNNSSAGSSDYAVGAALVSGTLTGITTLYASSVQSFSTPSSTKTTIEQRFNSAQTGNYNTAFGRNVLADYNSGTSIKKSGVNVSGSTTTDIATALTGNSTNYLLVTVYTISGANVTGATLYLFDQAHYANYQANSTLANANANLATYALATANNTGSAALSSYANLQFATFGGINGQISDFRLGTDVSDVVNLAIPPAITGLTNQTVLAGGSTTLSPVVNGNPAPTLQWYLSTDGGISSNAISGQTSSALALTSVQYSQNGYMYYLWASNASGTTVSNMTLTVVHTAPTVTGLTNQSAYAGNNVTMSATIGGAPFPALQWYYNGALIPNATNNSYNLTNVTLAQAGVYSLLASNEVSTVSNSMTLAVTTASVPPTLTGLTNQSVLAGGSTTLAATVGGNPAPTLQWYLSTDGGISSNVISGQTGSTLSLNNVQYSQNGYQYYLWANNTAGTTVSNMTLTVTTIAATVSGLTNQSVYAGNTVTMTAAAGGAPAPALQWFANGTPITSATNSTLVLTNVQISQNGNIYSLVAANVAGTQTNSMTLSVTYFGTINFDVNKYSQDAYAGTAMASDSGTNWNQFTVSAAPPVIAPNVFDSQSNTTPCSVTFNSSGGFSVWANATSVGNPNPSLLMRDYLFPNGAIYTVTVSNLPQGTYTLYAYAHGDGTGQTSTVTVNGANGGASGVTTDYGQFLNIYQANAAGNSYLSLNGTVSSSGTFSFTTTYLNGFQLQYIAPPSIAGLTNQTVIAGNATVLSPIVTGTAPLSYQWSSNNAPIVGATNATLALNNVQYSQDGTAYSLVVSNAAGAVTNNMTLSVIVTPNITGLVNQAVTVSSNTTISATVTGVPAPSLQWLFNNGVSSVILTDGPTGDGSVIAGSASSNLAISNAQSGESGTYSLIASNSAGMVTNSMNLTVASGNVAPTITGPANQTVIQGSNATFSASVTGLSVPVLQWLDQTGTPIPGATGSTLILTNVQYSQNSYTYSLVASNSAGQVTNTAVLTVLVSANISGQPQNLVVTNTQSATFMVTASGVPAPSYQWYYNGALIPSANGSTYTIGSASPANMGSYTVVVSNSVNVVTSQVATLTVNSTMGYASLLPANGAIGVCYDTPFYIHFTTTPVLRTAGTIRIYNVNNSITPVDAIDLSQSVTNHPTLAANVQAYTVAGMTVTNFPVIINGSTAAIYPHQGLLTSNQTYYVTVDNGTFADAAGAYFAGISATNAWKFATKVGGPVNATNLVVAQDYSGDFATVQGAVNYVPSGNVTPTAINIRNGVYTEVVNVNGRNNLDFRGQSRNGTLIGYPNNNNLNPGAPQRSAFIINGNDCTLETLTLTNMSPVGAGQAEAVDVEGTRAIFYNMELDSHQDTFLVHYSGKLVYFQDSLIAGDTDFNWGYGTVYYTNCELRSYGANVTQPRNPLGQRGFGFMNCRVTAANINVTSIGLGRTFGQVNAQALFANCLMDDTVTGFADASSTNTADYACSNLTATATKVLANSVHLTSSNPDVIAAQSAVTWLYGWQPQLRPNILSNPVDQSVTVGGTVTFRVVATGISVPTYQWLKNGIPLSGQTNSTLTLSGVTASDAASYSVTVSNAAGGATSSTATLTVNRTFALIDLQSSLNPSGYQSAVDFTATLPSLATGNVIFSTAGGAFCTNVLVSGVAVSGNISSLPRGTNLITAVYSGDANYLPGTNTLAQVTTNHPPTAGNVTYIRNAGIFQLNLAISTLLTNVTDADGDAITLVATSVTTNGITLTASGTNYLVYYNINNVNDQFSYTVTDGFGGTNTGVVNIVVNNAVTGPITGQLTGFGNNSADLTFHGIPGYNYITERSTNLTAWVDISTNTAGTNGVLNVIDGFSDLGSNAPPSAYYRLKYQP